MRSSIVKRSVIIRGHKTSVSLESSFWEGLKQIAAVRRIGLSDLLHEIDAARDNANLSSAIRVHVLEYFRSLALGELPQHTGRSVAPALASDELAAAG